MLDRMNRESDAIANPHFPHQLGNMRFDGALLDTQRPGDLLIRSARHEHFQHFFFAGSKVYAAKRKSPPRRTARLVDEHGKDSPRSPYQTLVYHADGLYELSRRCGFIDITLCTRSNRPEDRFITVAWAGDDDAH